MKTKDFLDIHKISPDTLDIDNCCSFIISEMNNSINGKKSSIPMIDSFCNPHFKIKSNKKVAVIDAGGTNFRTCIVEFDSNLNPIISDFKKTSMPGIEKEVSAKEFFCKIADETERLIQKTDRIGFCFSYAAKILPNHDGIPLNFSKEIKAPQVIGKELGKELFAELSSRNYDMSGKQITILNDTVATLLAAMSKLETENCNGCLGFILGTGTNCAYIGGDTVINEESGNLDISLGDIDNEFLNSTNNPNSYKFEKMISGAYLGHSSLFVLRQAQKEGVLSENLILPETFSTIDLGNFLDGSSVVFNNASVEDKDTIKQILEAFIFRAAKLTAASLAASILITDYGKIKPVLINADGTTFYKTPYLHDKTEFYLNRYLSEHERSAKFIKIENSPIIGSAIGALSL